MSDAFYTQEMLDSIKKVEASRASRIGFEPRRMTAEEKEALLAKFHPDYKKENFATLLKKTIVYSIIVQLKIKDIFEKDE